MGDLYSTRYTGTWRAGFFLDIGAMLGKDHATVIHGINAIESIMLHDKRIKSMYERCRSLYFGRVK